MTIADQTKPKLTVYYDGACPLCQTEIAHYRRQDGAQDIAFVDASDDTAELGPDLTREAALGRFHVRRADGRLVSGAAGFAEIWRHLPKWNAAARLAALPGMVTFLELLYRMFLPVRPVVSRMFGRLKGTDRS